MKSLIFVVGPTAVGKTDWAIQWARQDSGCILNSDSIQVYKDLKIGSAKPDFEKYKDITYYLFDEISAPQVWTAGDFRRKAFKILEKELPQRRVFVVGGSGFYIQALEKGMYKIKTPERRSTDQWKNKDISYLYELLKKKDPETAQQISPKDRYRILRSLILMDREGKTVSQIKREFREQKPPWPYLKVGLNISREELLKRVEKRVWKMLKEGLVEEIEQLLNRGLRDWRPLNSIGYREGILYLDGKIKREELANKIVSSTMFLAKKQKTWFKRDTSIKWFDFNQPALKVYKEIFK